MSNTLYGKSIISIQDLNLNDFKLIFARAKKYQANQGLPLTDQLPLESKIIASTFFEASTRTRLSFEATTQRLGGSVIGFADSSNTSLATKGEALKDTLKIIGAYADLLIIRHPQEGSARLAAEVCNIPVINAGDGANQHPTQTLLDLFTMQDIAGNLEGLQLVLVGDLKYGRVMHSLVQVAHLFKMRLYFVAFDQLALPETLLFQLKRQAVQFSFHKDLEEVIPVADIIYLTRIQKERLQGEMVKPIILTRDLLKKAKKSMKILHPLPRQEELPHDIDETPHAHYFAQAQNGIYIREALLDLILNNVSIA
jgi:aspartate carbamoyltransferase catalytic subunit